MASGCRRKVYSRDFLRQFDGCTDIPEGLELQSPALRDVIVPELLAHAGPPGRGGPRGSAMNGPPGVVAPADRWARPGPGDLLSLFVQNNSRWKTMPLWSLLA